MTANLLERRAFARYSGNIPTHSCRPGGPAIAGVDAVGPIGGLAAAASPPAASLPPANAAAGGVPDLGASPAASQPVTVPSSALAQPASSGTLLNGLSELEALAILALLSGNHRNHGADALSAMLVAAALNAYTSVQAVAAVRAPGANAVGGPTAGPGIDVRA